MKKIRPLCENNNYATIYWIDVYKDLWKEGKKHERFSKKNFSNSFVNYYVSHGFSLSFFFCCCCCYSLWKILYDIPVKTISSRIRNIERKIKCTTYEFSRHRRDVVGNNLFPNISKHIKPMVHGSNVV